MRSPASALPAAARLPLRSAAGAAAAALLLAGCSGGGGTGREDKAGEDEKSPSAPTGEVVAETELSYAEYEGAAEFAVNALSVQGDLMRLDYTLTPAVPEDGTETESVWGLFGFSITG
ncbi:hypothetical protein [Nocardiopsis coralliicola]